MVKFTKKSKDRMIRLQRKKLRSPFLISKLSSDG